MASCVDQDRSELCCWYNYNLTLVNNYSGSEIKTAKFKIDADNIIQSGANVDYKSGKEITLKPGFHAQNGSDFNARIIDCGE
ncbi:MAG TPA: hypothetical protein EYQ86_06460 [Bacteroidetes bacterium]|nr:hypothetical protein [Bacteroidota bacterium]